VPFVNPDTVIGEEPVPVNEPGLDVAVKVVIGNLPSYEGAVYVTVALAFPPVAVPIVGAFGTLFVAEAPTPVARVIMQTNRPLK
jgi:hypothetical protein